MDNRVCAQPSQEHFCLKIMLGKHWKMLGTGHYLWRGGGGGGGVVPKKNVSPGNIFADPSTRKSIFSFTQPQITIKNM